MGEKYTPFMEFVTSRNGGVLSHGGTPKSSILEYFRWDFSINHLFFGIHHGNPHIK
jgi:hypothetical protein